MILFLGEFHGKWLLTVAKRSTPVSALNNCWQKKVTFFLDLDIDFAEKRKESWLPLDFFDDSTFDDYSNEGWIEKKVDEDGNQRRLSAKGLRLVEDKYVYEPIDVHSFKTDS